MTSDRGIKTVIGPIGQGVLVSLLAYLAIVLSSFTPVGHFSRDFPRFLFSPRKSWAEAKSAERRQINVAGRWGAMPCAIAFGVYAATGTNVGLWGIGLGVMVGFLVWNGLEKRRLAAKYPEAE